MGLVIVLLLIGGFIWSAFAIATPSHEKAIDDYLRSDEVSIKNGFDVADNGMTIEQITKIYNLEGTLESDRQVSFRLQRIGRRGRSPSITTVHRKIYTWKNQNDIYAYGFDNDVLIAKIKIDLQTQTAMKAFGYSYKEMLEFSIDRLFIYEKSHGGYPQIHYID